MVGLGIEGRQVDVTQLMKLQRCHGVNLLNYKSVSHNLLVSVWPGATCISGWISSLLKVLSNLPRHIFSRYESTPWLRIFACFFFLIFRHVFSKTCEHDPFLLFCFFFFFFFVFFCTPTWGRHVHCLVPEKQLRVFFFHENDIQL